MNVIGNADTSIPAQWRKLDRLSPVMCMSLLQIRL